MGQPPHPDVVAMLIDQMVDELLLILEAIAAKVTKELALDPCQADAIDHALFEFVFMPAGELTILLILLAVRAQPASAHDFILELLLRRLLVHRSLPH